MEPTALPRPWGSGGRVGSPTTAYLQMTVGNTFEGPDNLTNSNKLKKATYPIWKEKVDGQGWEGHLSRSGSWM